MSIELILSELHLPASIAVSWILTYVLHSTVLLGLVWLITRRMSTRLSALRDTLWKVALAGGLVTAAAQTVIGFEPWGGRLDLPGQTVPTRPAQSVPHADDALTPAPLWETPAERGVIRVGLTEPLPSLVHLPIAGSEPVRRDRAVGVSLQEPVLHTAASEVAALDAASEDVPALYRAAATLATARDAAGTAAGVVGRNWMLGLLGSWILVSVFLLARLGWMRWRLHRVLRDRRELPAGVLTAKVDELSRRAGFDHRIKLSVSDHIPGPIAFGKREICLPERALRDLEAAQVAGLIGHELAHLVRRDPGWLSFCVLLERICFFQPLNRVGRRGIQDAAEYLCDDFAAELTGNGLTLAKCLAQVAGWVDRPARHVFVSGMHDGGSPLVRRVQHLLDDAGGPLPRIGRVSRYAAAAACFLFVAITVPGVTAGGVKGWLGAEDAAGPVADHGPSDFTPDAPDAVRAPAAPVGLMAHDVRSSSPHPGRRGGSTSSARTAASPDGIEVGEEVRTRNDLDEESSARVRTRRSSGSRTAVRPESEPVRFRRDLSSMYRSIEDDELRAVLEDFSQGLDSDLALRLERLDADGDVLEELDEQAIILEVVADSRRRALDAYGEALELARVDNERDVRRLEKAFERVSTEYSRAAARRLSERREKLAQRSGGWVVGPEERADLAESHKWSSEKRRGETRDVVRYDGDDPVILTDEGLVFVGPEELLGRTMVLGESGDVFSIDGGDWSEWAEDWSEWGEDWAEWGAELGESMGEWGAGYGEALGEWSAEYGVELAEALDLHHLRGRRYYRYGYDHDHGFDLDDLDDLNAEELDELLDEWIEDARVDALFEVFEDDPGILEDILPDRPALLDLADRNGVTLLHLAVVEDDTDVTQILLDAGANIDLRDDEDHTPLHYAALEGGYDMVELLLERGAEVDAIDENGRSPLHLAAIADEPDAAEVLLDAGADFDLEDDHGRTPFDWASRGQSEDVEDLIRDRR